MNKRDIAELIRTQNDRFRKTGVGGLEVITPGIKEMGGASVALVRQMVAADNKFDERNDPYQEHDFGSIVFRRQKIFWKIDYYDKTLSAGSPNPCDPDVTTRVLTIMLAREY